MSKKVEDKKNLHRDCRYCKPFTEGFFNNLGEPILGECPFVPQKVILNGKTNCKQWVKGN